MPASTDADPIDDKEVLFRRISVDSQWYDPIKSQDISGVAFLPSKQDDTGLSFFRELFISAADVAKGPSKNGYYVAHFVAGPMRNAGMIISPAPLQEVPGHCEVTNIRYCDRRSPDIINMAELLGKALHVRIEGPFPPAQRHG